MAERHTIRGIQVLRGLAACMVVVHHATQRFANLSERQTSFWENGASGVDIFFVISGFVMAVSTIGREDRDHPAKVFLKRRFIRLVPMYWLMTAIFIAISAFLRHHAKGGAADAIQVHTATGWAAVLQSLSFIPYRSPLGIQPILAVGWTLSYEVLFYLLFAATLALRVSVVRWLTPALVALALAGLLRTPGWPAFTVLADPLLLEFLAGLLLGYALLRGYRGTLLPALALGALALGCLLFVPTGSAQGLRVLVWGLPALLVVHAIVIMEPNWGRHWPSWALLLGDASYSLYLSHNMVMNILFSVLVRLHLAGTGHGGVTREWVDAALCLLLTTAIALVLYRFVERPLTEALKQRLIRQPEPSTARA